MMIVLNQFESINSKYIVDLKVRIGVKDDYELIVYTVDGRYHVKSFKTKQEAQEAYENLFDLINFDKH